MDRLVLEKNLKDPETLMPLKDPDMTLMVQDLIPFQDPETLKDQDITLKQDMTLKYKYMSFRSRP